MLDEVLQGEAVHVLHGVVGLAPDVADGVDVDDVRVVEVRGGTDLPLKPLPDPGIGRDGRRHHLEGDAPARGSFLGFVDDAHPSVPDLADDAEVVDLFWRVVRHWHQPPLHRFGVSTGDGRCARHRGT